MDGTCKTTKDPTFFRSVRNYFREYCNCSSIHGFRYFGERRTYFERSWWFVVFAISLVACAILIHEDWQKWRRSPKYTISFATTETSIHEIPFPAVTICPQAKNDKSKFNHADILRKQLHQKWNVTEREQQLFDYMGLICDGISGVIVLGDYSNSSTVGDDFFAELLNISTNHPVFYCFYMGIPCVNKFIPIITDDGICYTFNILDRSDIYNDSVVKFRDFHHMNHSLSDWNTHEGIYTNGNGTGSKPYPRRATLAGTKHALSLVLSSSKDTVGSTCKGAITGFKVILHMPSRVPRPSAHSYFMVPHEQVVLAAVQPVMLTTSEAVKHFKPKDRDCYYPYERSLKYFKIYTALNCELECLTNYTLDCCGCVNYYMPRENTTVICGIGKFRCMQECENRVDKDNNSNYYDFRLTRSKITNTTTPICRQRQKINCDCKPLCNDITYNAEISQSNWKWSEYLQYNIKNKAGKFPFTRKKGDQFSNLIIYFKSSKFMASKRYEQFGPKYFLATFGGLLGLFTGLSVLSLMELVYFFTMRIFFNVRLYGYWAGPRN